MNRCQRKIRSGCVAKTKAPFWGFCWHKLIIAAGPIEPRRGGHPQKLTRANSVLLSASSAEVKARPKPTCSVT